MLPREGGDPDWAPAFAGEQEGGVLLLAIAVTALHPLASFHAQAGPFAFLLATIGFLCASGGAMLVVVGGHIHDPVRISARGTAPRDRPRLRRALSTRTEHGSMLPHCSMMTKREHTA